MPRKEGKIKVCLTFTEQESKKIEYITKKVPGMTKSGLCSLVIITKIDHYRKEQKETGFLTLKEIKDGSGKKMVGVDFTVKIIEKIDGVVEQENQECSLGLNKKMTRASLCVMIVRNQLNCIIKELNERGTISIN